MEYDDINQEQQQQQSRLEGTSFPNETSSEQATGEYNKACQLTRQPGR